VHSLTPADALDNSCILWATNCVWLPIIVPYRLQRIAGVVTQTAASQAPGSCAGAWSVERTRARRGIARVGIELRMAGCEAARRKLLQYGYSLIATPLIEVAPIGLEVATGVSSPKLSIENTATYPLFELV
jgi:hypothetical protein